MMLLSPLMKLVATNGKIVSDFCTNYYHLAY